MKEIPIFNKKTNQEHKVKVDDEDFDNVNQFKWTFHPRGYVRSNKNVMMHHLIIGNKSSEGLVVDHINQDKLDNRKENLRHVCSSKNAQNAIRKINKHGYIGIYQDKNNKYTACIRATTDNVNIKYRTKGKDSPEEAAKQYDILAFNIYGKNALTNKLIDYEDAISYNINDIITKKPDRTLPKNIVNTKWGYVIKKNIKVYIIKNNFLL